MSSEMGAAGPSLSRAEEDLAIVRAVLGGDRERYGELMRRHQARVFAAVRRYSRREDEVEDIVQEVFLKAFERLGSFRGEAPFEHWLMRLTVRMCYDFLRGHQRNRERTFSSLTEEEWGVLERVPGSLPQVGSESSAVKELVHKVLEQLSPPSRLVLTLLELEDRSVKEISALTGWSVPWVKVRAFRARAEMRQVLERMGTGRFL